MREIARTIALTAPFVRGTVSLAARMLRLQPADAQSVIERLTPGRSPTFGELWDVTGPDVERLAGIAGASVSPVDARAFADLCRKADPWTPMCPNCGELTLSAVAGKVYDIPALGTVCPFCSAAAIALSPVVLRRVNWATGALVEPGIAEDIRSVPGKVIPLTDEKIRAWAKRVDPALDRALADAGVPLYAFLAYFNLSANAPDRFGPRKAEELLGNPRAFGLDRPAVLDRHIDAAERFRDAREITNAPSIFLTDGMRRADLLPVTINGRPYLLEGLVGQGDKCDVYRGRSDAASPTFVTVKVMVSEDEDDARRFRDELAVIRRLGGFDDVESEFYLRFVPRLVESGSVVFPDGTTMSCAAFRAEHQFDWTLDDVRQEYADGIHPKDLVWMMNRVCELLTWLHTRRLVHRAIIPPHLLVKTSTHRLRLVDWGYASSFGRPIDGYSASNRDYYPEAVLNGDAFGPGHDLAMACRVGIALLGGDPATGRTPSSIRTDDEGRVDVPEPLVTMLRDHAMYPGSRPTAPDARGFKDRFGSAARAAYGPPTYHLFTMPRR